MDGDFLLQLPSYCYLTGTDVERIDWFQLAGQQRVARRGKNYVQAPETYGMSPEEECAIVLRHGEPMFIVVHEDGELAIFPWAMVGAFGVKAAVERLDVDDVMVEKGETE